ncbi:MAG: DUF5119 domain-containing protein [Paludibacteraceae bacterium]|nr:DUF5119 domain-containing protein [Paludibacteraceae bacterium]
MFILILFATSCDRRQLWDEWDELVPVDIKVDWSGSRWPDFDEGAAPTGMSVYAYDQTDKQDPVVVVTNEIEHTELKLYDGEWNIFVFNQSVMEYASLKFSGMDKYSSAQIETIPQVSRWFSSSRAEWVTRSNSPWAVQTRANAETRADEYSLTTKQPIWFANDCYEGVIIDEDKIIREFTPHTRFSDGIFYTKSSIIKMGVKVHFKGYGNLYTVRSVISGVAKSYNISPMHAQTEMTAHELTGWKGVAETDSTGYVETTFQTFGLVKGYTYKPEELYLHLDVMLVDGETIMTYDLPVGNLVKKSNEDDIDLIIDVEDPLELPNVKMTGDGNGFDITVSDWEDEINIDIDL